MKLGFFGGSFNPPTYAHLNIARTVIENLKLDTFFFVPMGNSYNKIDLADEKFRYDMLNLMCKDEKNIKVEDIELNRKETTTTIQAFKMIEEKYNSKNNEIYYIMGADNFKKLPNWKDAEELAKGFKYIIINRDNINIEELINSNKLLNKYKENFTVICIEDKYKDISSTIVRNLAKDEHYDKIGEYTTKLVKEYIKENKIYKF